MNSKHVDGKNEHKGLLAIILASISVSLYMALVPMFLGYLLFSYGLNTIEVSKATLITLLEPLVAAILAIVIIGETFALEGWFGMSLIFVCLLLQAKQNNPK